MTQRSAFVLRVRPDKIDDLTDIPGLRKWQIAEMGEDFVRALGS